jgi:hypothetical protein
MGFRESSAVTNDDGNFEVHMKDEREITTQRPHIHCDKAPSYTEHDAQDTGVAPYGPLKGAAPVVMIDLG